jgi:NAD(P)-dependent dehydrogenase (short-subunit alcohol dehydrogenase family)
MAKEGADIAIPDIQDANANAVVKEVQALGRKAIAMRCDVTKAADVKASLDGAAQQANDLIAQYNARN